MKFRQIRLLAAFWLLLPLGACVTAEQAEPRTTAKAPAARMYALQGVYFKGRTFPSLADCLTAASTERLPLEVCQ
jgi:hypothetical protein